jgi:hypothetical protein
MTLNRGLLRRGKASAIAIEVAEMRMEHFALL